jgi:hypothetical protein
LQISIARRHRSHLAFLDRNTAKARAQSSASGRQPIFDAETGECLDPFRPYQEEYPFSAFPVFNDSEPLPPDFAQV